MFFACQGGPLFFAWKSWLQTCPLSFDHITLCQPAGPKDPQLSKSPNTQKWVFRSSWNVFDFKKISKQKLTNFLGGYPLLAPQIGVSPKISTQALPMTLLFSQSTSLTQYVVLSVPPSLCLPVCSS